MPVSLLVSLLVSSWFGLTTSLAATNWIQAGRQSKLGLLPFPLEECLLPGESKQVHLYEARFIQLFADSAAERHDCLGQLLFTPSGNVAAITALLEVEEFRKEEYGVWARLKCVGRVQLDSVKQTEYGYVEADCKLVVDAKEAGGEPSARAADADGTTAAGGDEGGEGARTPEMSGAMAATAEAAAKAAAANGVSEAQVIAAAVQMLAEIEGDISEVHRSLVSMRGRLGDADAATPPPPQEDERVEWGHEQRSGAAELTSSLGQIIGARRDLLLSRGLDALPLTAVSEAVGETWGVATEEEAERQLFSFASAAVLSPLERAQALGMTSTSERLAHVLCALKAQQRNLAAQLALREALPGP